VITSHPKSSSRRERLAWYLYDVGYFKQQVVGGAQGSWLWGLSVGIAMLVVAVTSPFLGTLADYSGAKKRYLLFFTVMACVFFILAEIGYRSAQVFYNALLPEIAPSQEMGRISGRGWALGNVGGIACLIIVLALIKIFPGTLTIRLSFVLTALFFAGYGSPSGRRSVVFLLGNL